MKGILAISAIIVLSGTARAWNGKTHSALARLALQGDPALTQPVAAESLADFLSATGQGDVAAFDAKLRLNPSAAFSFKLPGEASGSLVSPLDVIATYVNEPDWGMDQGICAAYPGTCSPDLKFMGAFEKGLPSQAFRHMYWPTGYIKIFKKFLPIPLHEDKPIGEAPQRCQLFFDMSVRAARSGHPYWAARFLAWSMHYAQDVTQPFHAAQLPSKHLMGTTHLIPSMAKTVKKLSYYHLAFEGYIAALLDGAQGQAIEQRLRQSISGVSDLKQTTAAGVAQAAAAHSVSESFAKRTGEAAMKFFPPIPDLDHTDIEQYIQSDQFRQELARRSQPGPILDEFVAIASSCLGVGGAASHTLLDLYFQTTQAPLVTQKSYATPPGFQARIQALSAALLR
jgi:hypothetical protein